MHFGVKKLDTAKRYVKGYRIEDLSWEKSTTWGIGLDAVINHVTFTFDYYDRKTTDIIMEVPVPTEFGLDPYFDNVGSMRNRGVEVQLGLVIECDGKYGL